LYSGAEGHLRVELVLQRNVRVAGLLRKIGENQAGQKLKFGCFHIIEASYLRHGALRFEGQSSDGYVYLEQISSPEQGKVLNGRLSLVPFVGRQDTLRLR
jgi:hypothetical protein